MSGKFKCLTGVTAAGGGTATVADATRWLGDNHVRGVTFRGELVVEGGHTTLVGCVLQGGVKLSADARLSLIGCQLICPRSSSANVKIGKRAAFDAYECAFTVSTLPRQERSVTSMSLLAFLCVACRNSAHDSRASSDLYSRAYLALSRLEG
jgi:hypothetical protein